MVVVGYSLQTINSAGIFHPEMVFGYLRYHTHINVCSMLAPKPAGPGNVQISERKYRARQVRTAGQSCWPLSSSRGTSGSHHPTTSIFGRRRRSDVRQQASRDSDALAKANRALLPAPMTPIVPSCDRCVAVEGRSRRRAGAFHCCCARVNVPSPSPSARTAGSERNPNEAIAGRPRGSSLRSYLRGAVHCAMELRRLVSTCPSWKSKCMRVLCRR
jgi:hypothetical protein